MAAWWLIAIVAFLAATATGRFLMHHPNTGSEFPEDDIQSGDFRGT
jgi:hypothetical protein